MSSDLPISGAIIVAKITELRAEVETAEQTLDRLRTELEWWEKGHRLFGDETPPEPKPPPPPAAEKTSANGSKPSLRKGITAILGAEPIKTWKTEAVIEELRQRKWLPGGKNAEHHVRSMLAEMHRKGQARRMGRGRYRLPLTGKEG